MHASRVVVAMPNSCPHVAGSTVLRDDRVDAVIDIMLTWSDTHPEYTGRLLAAIADEWGVDQKTACRRAGRVIFRRMKKMWSVSCNTGRRARA